MVHLEKLERKKEKKKVGQNWPIFWRDIYGRVYNMDGVDYTMIVSIRFKMDPGDQMKTGYSEMDSNMMFEYIF